METVQEIKCKKVELYYGTDGNGRTFVAGKTGSGKSTYLKGIATSHDFRYIGEECLNNFSFPMTCDDLLGILQTSGDVKGLVLDFSGIEAFLIDFKSYKWNIPVCYSIQLNRNGNFNIHNINYFKLGDFKLKI